MEQQQQQQQQGASPLGDPLQGSRYVKARDVGTDGTALLARLKREPHEEVFIKVRYRKRERQKEGEDVQSMVSCHAAPNCMQLKRRGWDAETTEQVLNATATHMVGCGPWRSSSARHVHLCALQHLSPRMLALCFAGAELSQPPPHSSAP